MVIARALYVDPVAVFRAASLQADISGEDEDFEEFRYHLSVHPDQTACGSPGFTCYIDGRLIDIQLLRYQKSLFNHTERDF